MEQQYTISQITINDLPILFEWAKKAGWNPGLNDISCFYKANPQGFFIGKLNDQIIAIGSAIIYDEKYAFCGFYIVDPSHRGKGFGLALTKARLDYIGTRNAGLDGVVPMLPKYARLGYKIAHQNTRYKGINLSPNLEHHPAIHPMSAINFGQLREYDRLHFPAHRDSFLRCWIHQPGSKTIAYLENNQIKGYGMIRPSVDGFRIGPLFADNSDIANQLFINLAHHARGAPVYLDIPACNQDAIKLISDYQLTPVFETARMYLQDPPNIIMEHVYAITSLELG